MQKIIFREDNKSFNKINDITLFEGEENADYLEILIPQKYNKTDLSDCNIRLTYITSDDYENTFLIDEYRQDILYKDNLVYLINIDERFTSVVGEIKIYLTFSKTDEKDVLFKSGVATIYIKDHPSGSNELTEKELDIIDQVVLISNKALKTAESVEEHANNGEFFPTVEITETEDGHNISFKTVKQEETVEVKNGDDYVITDEDKKEIAQDVIEAVTPNIDEQVVKAGEILDEKATQKANEINVSLDEHKDEIISDIDEHLSEATNQSIEKVNEATNNNISNINNATMINIGNINNVTNTNIGNIDTAKHNAILDINTVKTNALNDVDVKRTHSIDEIVNKTNESVDRLVNQENILANNLNEATNQHIHNIDDEANQKITEIDEKVTNVQERADNGEFDGFSPTIETEKVENKTKITITNKTGISETEISDGVVPVYNEESDYVVFKNAQQLEADGLISAIYGGEE